ncbi:hypothetical protein ACVW0K_000825 [Streptomyces filamentosus]
MIASPAVRRSCLRAAVEGEAEGVEFHEGVEVAAVGEVVGDGAEAGDLGLEVESDGEGGDVGEGDGAGGAVLDADVGGDEAGRGVEADGGDRFDDRDHAGLDEDGGDADGAVAAHREQAGDLDEEDSVVGVGPGRGLEDRAAHGGVAARLVHEQGAQGVAVLDEVEALLGHGGAGDHPHSAGDHPGGHALGVGVHRVVDVSGAHGLVFSSLPRG